MAETKFNQKTAEKIADFEADNRITFPREFVDLLYVFEGKTYPNNVVNGWLSLDKIKETIGFWHDFLRNSFGERWSKVRVAHFHSPESVSSSLYNNKWIPFLKLNNVLWCLDFAPRSHGKKGQVIRVDYAPDPTQYHIRLENLSFADWFAEKTASGDSAYAINNNMIYDNPVVEEKSPFNPPFRKEIKEHISHFIGDIKQIFSEPPSAYESIELLHAVYSPDTKDCFNVIVSCGMSAEPIRNNKDFNGGIPHYVELMVLLPADWPIGIGVFADLRNYWPVHWLRTLSKMPREYEKFPVGGQTFTNGKNNALIAETQYSGVLLFPPLASFPEEFALMETPDGGVLHFYALIPLMPEELKFKEEKGLNELLREIRERAAEGKIKFMDRIADSRHCWIPLREEEKTIYNQIDESKEKAFGLLEYKGKSVATSLAPYSKDFSLDGLNSKIDELIKRKIAADAEARKNDDSFIDLTNNETQKKVNSFIDLANEKK